MVYAKQIAPEYQESPLFLNGCFPDNIILTGNRQFNSHTTPEYDKIVANETTPRMAGAAGRGRRRRGRQHNYCRPRAFDGESVESLYHLRRLPK